MRDSMLWNRRDFVKLAGCSSLGAMTTRAPWLRAEVPPRFAFVGGHGIGVFAIEGERWRPAGGVSSLRPSFLTLHPNERFLYAIQEVDQYKNLRSGFVEAYAINENDGSLALLNRQPLSLSAIAPRHGAVSPDGRALVVAVHGGGAYNVLPITEDGSLGRVSGILKETGSGPHEEHQQTAHPQMVTFDSTGHRFLGADLGSDRLSVFALGEGRLHVVQRIEARPGSGPRRIELHPDGHLFFVASELDASVSCYGYDVNSGRILKQLQHVPANRAPGGEQSGMLMTMHPSGQFLYTAASGVTAWRIDTTTGALRPIHHESEQSSSLHAMVMTSGGSSLLGLSRQSESVISWSIDRTSGRLSRPAELAKIQAPLSLALKYL
jgi:6-phosphogluconolactonase